MASLRLALDYGLDGTVDRARCHAEAHIADELGLDSIWVAETWGVDAFSVLTQLADRTSRVRLGTFVVNIFSRSPTALAQAFASLDSVSGGRAVAGIGVGTAAVAREWHGTPFEKPLARLREYAAIMRQVFGRKRLDFRGELFALGGGYVLREPPARDTVPVWLGAVAPAAVRLAAEVADGWFPQFIPVGRLEAEVAGFREMVAAGGRDPAAVEVKAPGVVTVTGDAGLAYLERARFHAYVIRHMSAMRRQLVRMGREDILASVDRAWEEGGGRAAAPALAGAMGDAFDFAGPVEACRERLWQQAGAGVDVSAVAVEGADSAGFARVLDLLLR